MRLMQACTPTPRGRCVHVHTRAPSLCYVVRRDCGCALVCLWRVCVGVCVCLSECVCLCVCPWPQDAAEQLDLSWSMSGMSVSGSVGGGPKSARRKAGGVFDVPGDGDVDVGTGLEVVGRHMAIPKLLIANSFHAEPEPDAGRADVASQLQQISESYRVGLISPEERGLLKNHVIMTGLERRVRWDLPCLPCM